MVGSLPVPNVQALAAEIGGSGEKNIPARYIRSEEMAEPVVVAGYGEEIPVIDFSWLLDPKSSNEESAKLHSACRDWGFFQLINHEISSEVIEEMKGVIEEFFKLPLREKQAISQPPGDIEGFGQLFVVSDDQKLDWADMLYLYTHPISRRKLHLWPTIPSKFRATLDQYSSEVFKTSKCLISLMLRNLGVVDINKGRSEDFFKDWMQSVRINYYPPCPENHQVLGLSPHSDAAAIALLLQVNPVPGLQIKHGGIWVPVTPLPGAFVINIGDSVEIFSDGEYKSIEHRAVVDANKGRISIAAFSGSTNAEVGPLPELLTNKEASYKTVDHESFVKLFFSAKLDGKRFLDSLKLEK